MVNLRNFGDRARRTPNVNDRVSKFTLELLTPPAVKAITLESVRLNLRLDHIDEDDLLNDLIDMATEISQTITSRQFITATYRWYLDNWPEEGILRPPLPPLQSVSSIKFQDIDGNQQTIDAADYEVDNKKQPGRIRPVPNFGWPSLDDVFNPIVVEYICGFGDAASDVLASIRQALKLIVNHLYENREEVVTIGKTPAVLPEGVQRLLTRNRNLLII